MRARYEKIGEKGETKRESEGKTDQLRTLTKVGESRMETELWKKGRGKAEYLHRTF